MIELFKTIFYYPLLNLLILFYNIIPGHDIGAAIIALTILIKLALFPFTAKSLRSQKALQAIQPKLEALKKQYKNQKEKLASETMKLYRQEKINPFSSCLPVLIQLPFLIALFHVFRTGLTDGSLEGLYPFIANPGQLKAVSFGFLNLAEPQAVLAVLAGLAQFFQVKMLSAKKPAIKTPGSRDEGMAAAINKQMTFFMPLVTVLIGSTLMPGGVVLYWLVVTLLTIAQQLVIFHQDKKNSPPAEKKLESQKSEINNQ